MTPCLCARARLKPAIGVRSVPVGGHPPAVTRIRAAGRDADHTGGMSNLGNLIRDQHREMSVRLGELAVLLGREPDRAARELDHFILRRLVPHARAEESTVYAQLDRMGGTVAPLTQTMRVDHDVIHDLARRIRVETAALNGAGTSAARQAVMDRLRDLLSGLRVLVDAHMLREERVYLPLLEGTLSAAQEREALAALGDGARA